MDKFPRSDEQLLCISIEEDGGRNDVAINKLNKQHQLLESGEEASGAGINIKTSLRGKEEKILSKSDYKTKSDYEAEELLGSVITHNCLGTRTSARVIQKMKQDQQTRPGTPPPNERETAPSRKDERTVLQKTPSQVRANKPSWNNLERNYFFDALNEFGKDFEAIGSYINTKLKRRNPATNISCKSKDQVRQHYYQTYHKICKYIQVRKPVQELYALINYGEMRRKLQFVTDKHFMKLRNLVYHGHITVRCKGKNIRIKTPSCKALRRLNQLDDSLEDIKLPSKIEVIISPANMEAFCRVQAIAQNPRCRTTVPLHKKLVNFIKAFQYKWRSNETKIAEEAKLCTNNGDSQVSSGAAVELGYVEPEICFLPKPGITIHRPLLSITEYLSSVNICLTAYEERIGVKIKGITLNSERTNSSTLALGGSGAALSILTNPKRIRTESGSEKRSPDSQLKRQKPNDLNNGYETPLLSGDELLADVDLLQHKNESSGDELSDEIQELLSDSLDMQSTKEDSAVNEMTSKPNCEMKDASLTHSSNAVGRNKRPMNTKSSRSIFKPLLNEEVIQRIRSGWTISTASDITIGDLYVVLGHDSKLELDYYWPSENTRNSFATLNTCSSLNTINDLADCALTSVKPNGLRDNEDCQIINNLNSSTLSNKLKHLLLIANLSERLRKRQCQCERNVNTKSRIERELGNRTFLANKIYNYPNNSCTSGSDNHNTFKPPLVPIRRPSIDPMKQLTNLTRQKVLVQRLLLPTNSTANSNIGSGNNAAHPIETRKCDITQISQEKEDIQLEQIDCPENPDDDNNDAISKKESSSSPISDEASLDINDLGARLQDCLEEAENMPNGQDLTTNANGSATANNAFDECSNTSFLNALSPMQLLRESTSNSRWLEENLNDFSLTSLLGHLDEINASRDILDPSSNLSVISESSVDYMHKFQEIKALLQSQEKD
uniref:SANT domain-containing protein n=1 Tax=Glossina morsitans morsitans TaxID=37546 RepID=A0A1B0G208_GLOMM